METLLAFIAVIIATIQLCRTPKPKPKPEPFTPTCLTIIGVPMRRGPDLPGMGNRHQIERQF